MASGRCRPTPKSTPIMPREYIPAEVERRAPGGTPPLRLLPQSSAAGDGSPGDRAHHPCRQGWRQLGIEPLGAKWGHPLSRIPERRRSLSLRIRLIASDEIAFRGGDIRLDRGYPPDHKQRPDTELGVRRFAIALLKLGQEKWSLLLRSCFPHDLAAVQRLTLAGWFSGRAVR